MKPSSAIQAIIAAIEAGEVVMIWGTWGSGKSEGVAQVFEILNRKKYEIRTPLIDGVDLRGCPDVQTIDGKLMTIWGYPGFFPTEPGCGVFIDEINSGLPQIQASCYQLVLDKACGEHQLPPDTAMVCAGNREGDGGVTHKMPLPLANRLVHVDWELDVDDWVSWALANNVRTDIIAFIRFRPTLLHQDMIDASLPEGERKKRQSRDGAKKAMPSPRTWVKCSNIVNACEKLGSKSDVEYGLVMGCVGEGPGTEYLAFKRIASSLVSPDQIILDPDNAPVPDVTSKDGPAACYALVTVLATKASDKTVGRILKYADRLPADYQVVLVKDILARDSSLINTREMIEWGTKNHDVVI